MQPQDSGFDWLHALSAGAGAIIGAGSAVLTWVMKAARMEPLIRAEITAAEKRVEEKIDEKIDLEMGHFRETLSGIREKINEVERDSMPRDDFKEFMRQHREDLQKARQETREDFAELKRNIAEMFGKKH